MVDSPISIATVMSTVLSDTQLGNANHVIFEEDGVTAARIHGKRYQGITEDGRLQRSEDSLLVVHNFSGESPLNLSEALTAVTDITKQIRAETAQVTGGATVAGIITGKDGVVFLSIGDSSIFIIGDKIDEHGKRIAIQINTPQKSYTGKIMNGIGTVPEKRLRENQNDTLNCNSNEHYLRYAERDELNFLPWDKIEELVGNHAKIIVTSDGMVEKSVPAAPIYHSDRVGDFRLLLLKYRDFLRGDTSESCSIAANLLHKYREERKKKQAEELALLYAQVEETGIPVNAKALASAALARGSTDDISVVMFDVPPKRQIAAFISDGMGGVTDEKGAGNGAMVSQTAVNIAQQWLLDLAKKHKVTNVVTAQAVPFDTLKIWQAIIQDRTTAVDCRLWL